MKISISLLPTVLGVLWATTGATYAHGPIANDNRMSTGSKSAAARIVYVSDRSQNKILMYRLGKSEPTGAITNGVVQAQGIAVDSVGDLYVANGNGGNVLEYAPGGAGPIRVFSAGLHHPVSVTIDSSNNMYVAEQSPSSIVKYSKNGSPTPAIYYLPYPNEPVRGVAVDRAGDIIASISGIADLFPPAGSCLSVSMLFMIPTGATIPIYKFLTGTEQVFGLAISASGALYASDPCLNNVSYYSLPGFTATGYLRNRYSFNEPFYITIANGYLSVPSAGQGRSGYVTVVDMASPTTYYSFSLGLVGPISAVVGSLHR